MNWLTDLYWNIRLKIEDKIYEWQANRELARLEKEDAPFVDDNEISANWEDEEVEVKPKKKKAKKKSVKKAKKSV